MNTANIQVLSHEENNELFKICKKVGEEATEVVIGAKNRDKEEVKWESADLMYHLLVLLQEQKVDIYEVLEVLQKRHEGKPQK